VAITKLIYFCCFDCFCKTRNQLNYDYEYDLTKLSLIQYLKRYKSHAHILCHVPVDMPDTNSMLALIMYPCTTVYSNLFWMYSDELLKFYLRYLIPFLCKYESWKKRNNKSTDWLFMAYFLEELIISAFCELKTNFATRFLPNTNLKWQTYTHLLKHLRLVLTVSSRASWFVLNRKWFGSYVNSRM